ncbi:hypothetical protein ACIBP4_18740 [Micromonospora maritima]|uniref:Uncharacterized protein n=1 Tax=Micromonospora maritima TaxID=986711 RepID=A0ABW7ZN98_9ACTN
MTRRSWLLAASSALGVVLLAACGGAFRLARSADTGERDCAARVAAEEATIRTDRRWTDRDVPGVGAYPEIHWQVDYPSFACSRAPGPTDLRYQGVVRLAPADARALATTYVWTPGTGAAPEVWPGLGGYVPDGVRWRRSADHDAAGTAEVWFDPARSLLLFTAVDT